MLFSCNPAFNAPLAENGTKPPSMNPPDDDRATWKTARFAASPMSCALNTILRRKNSLSPQNWNREARFPTTRFFAPQRMLARHGIDLMLAAPPPNSCTSNELAVRFVTYSPFAIAIRSQEHLIFLFSVDDLCEVAIELPAVVTLFTYNFNVALATFAPVYPAGIDERSN